MGSIYLLCVGLLSVAAVSQAGRVVCYYGSWATYRWGNGKCDITDLDPNLCTHLIYGFAGLDAGTNTIISLDPFNDLPDDYGKASFKKFNDLRKVNPSLKTLIAIGGWNEGSAKYSKMASNSASRKQLLNSVISFLGKHGFNGLDIDWEYPSARDGAPADKANFALLLKEFREEFDKYGYLLSAAVGAGPETVQAAYDVPSLSRYLDFINVMTYDFHGSWETNAGHNAPLYSRPDESPNQKLLNLNASIHNFINKGAEPAKLNLGMGSYGQAFTLTNPSNHDVYAPASPGIAGPYTSQAGILGYNEICEKFLKETWTVIKEEYYQAPYAYRGNQWVGYDDPQSIAVKSIWARNLGLGGGMVWSIETDDFKGICGPKYPLISAIANAFTGSSQPEASAPATITAEPATTAKPATTAPPATTAKPATTASPAPTTTKTTKTTTTSPTTVPASGQQQCTSPGFLRDPLNCNIFYECDANGSGFTKYKFNCPAGLVFDLVTSQCRWQSDVPECQ